MNHKFDFSVVIPVLDEADSLGPLLGRLLPILQSIGTHEIIFVNDGSADDSGMKLDKFADQYSGIVKVLHLKRNWGKSIALQTGFQEASGKWVIMMDADLQDRPEEIPKLLKHLEENDLDIVTGWKVVRKDPLSKKLPSLLFNTVLRYFSGLKIHDFNCGLKLMRNECLNQLRLYGQLHRFILVLLAHQGMKIGEIEVEHSPRKYGKSKYGVQRLYRGLLDFITVIFVTRYLQSPLYIFGLYSMWCFGAAFVIGAYYFGKHFFYVLTDFPGGSLEQNPIWLLSLLFSLAALIFICFGLIGELVYHLISKHDNENFVQKKVGFKG